MTADEREEGRGEEETSDSENNFHIPPRNSASIHRLAGGSIQPTLCVWSVSTTLTVCVDQLSYCRADKVCPAAVSAFRSSPARTTRQSNTIPRWTHW